MNRLLSEFYSPIEDINPPSWEAWQKGYLSMKPFSMQIRECKANGNLYMENCGHCSNVLLICKRHGGQCVSNKCREERVSAAMQHINELNKSESK